MRTTENDKLIRVNSASYQEKGFTRTQALQLAYCDIWQTRPDVNLRRFICSCSDCPERLATSRILEVRAYIERHKKHRTKVTTRAV